MPTTQQLFGLALYDNYRAAPERSSRELLRTTVCSARMAVVAVAVALLGALSVFLSRNTAVGRR